MCVQKYTKCRNYKCNNLLEILDLDECPHKPNCETEVLRVPIDKSSDRVHCDDCASLTRGQRIGVRAYERRLELHMERHMAQMKQGSDQMRPSEDARGIQTNAGEQEASGSSPGALAMSREQTTAEPRMPSDAEELSLPTTPPIHQSTKSEDEALEAALTLVSMSRGFATRAGEGTLIE